MNFPTPHTVDIRGGGYNAPAPGSYAYAIKENCLSDRSLHTTINRRQRNGWTTEIQECHRLVSRQLEDLTQLEIYNTAPWEQLPYECRIDWIKEGTEVLKERSLAYISSQPDDNTYYTDGSCDGTRAAATVVHKKEKIINRLNDLASVLDAEMTAIRLALENARKTRDMITIRIDSLTAVNILSNRNLYLRTITSAIRDVASRLTQRPTINWIPAHTGIPGNEKDDQAAKAPNDTAYKRWSCHSGLKLLCKLGRTFPPPSMWARFTVFGHAGHADPLDGWRCCSQKQVLLRPIQVRQL